MSHNNIPQRRIDKRLTKNLSRIIKSSAIELPSLKNFSIEEIPQLKKHANVFLKSLTDEDKLFTSLKVPIKKKYLQTLENEKELHSNILLYFLRYLLNLQKTGGNSRIYIMALEMEDFSDPNALKYMFLPGMENIYENVDGLINFDYLVYLIKLEERWIIELIRLKDNKPFLIDFINPVLSRLHIQQIHSVFINLHKDIFHEDILEQFNYLENILVRTLSDYSIQTCFILYNLVVDPIWLDIEEKLSHVSENEMNDFSNQIIWLIYTLMTQKQIDGNKRENSKRNLTILKNPSSIDNIIDKKDGIVPTKDVKTLSIPQKLLVDLLKEMKKEILEEVSKTKPYSEVDKYINEKVAGNSEIKLDDFHLKFSKNELKDVLIKYGENIQNQHSLKTYQSQQKEKDFYQNYQNLNHLLWYYYQYDQITYSKLLEEYNNRLHNHLLSSLGLPPLPQYMYQKPKEKTPPKEYSMREPNDKKVYIPQYNVSAIPEISLTDTTKNNLKNKGNLGSRVENKNRQVSIKKPTITPYDIGSPKNYEKHKFPNNHGMKNHRSKANISVDQKPEFSFLNGKPSDANNYSQLSPTSNKSKYIGSGSNHTLGTNKPYSLLENNYNNNPTLHRKKKNEKSQILNGLASKNYLPQGNILNLNDPYHKITSKSNNNINFFPENFKESLSSQKSIGKRKQKESRSPVTSPRNRDTHKSPRDITVLEIKLPKISVQTPGGHIKPNKNSPFNSPKNLKHHNDNSPKHFKHYNDTTEKIQINDLSSNSFRKK